MHEELCRGIGVIRARNYSKPYARSYRSNAVTRRRRPAIGVRGHRHAGLRQKIAADQILRPTGVPDSLIRQFIKGRDPATGDALTKRQGGAIILDELAKTGADHEGYS